MTRPSLYRAFVATALACSLMAPSLASAHGLSAEAGGRLSFGRAVKAEIHSFIAARKEAHAERKVDKKERKESKKSERRQGEAPAASKEVSAACMKPAVSKREDALVAAGDVHATSMRNAHATRRTALLSAWDMTDAAARRTAIDAAWDAYASSATTARKTFINARAAAWAQFSVDRKACGQEAATLDEVRASAEVRI